MLICPSCKIEYSKGSKYCNNCGGMLVKLLLDIDEGAMSQAKEKEAEGADVTMACPKCGTTYNKAVNYCSSCGAKISASAQIKVPIAERTTEALATCPFCFSQYDAKSVNCPSCGAEVTKEQASEPVAKKQEAVPEAKEEAKIVTEVETRKEPITEKVSVKQIKGDELKSKADLVTYESMKLDDTAALAEAAKIKCPSCGHIQEAGWEMCKKCGKLLSIPAPDISNADFVQEPARKSEIGIEKKEEVIPRKKEIKEIPLKVPKILPKIPSKHFKPSFDFKENFENFISSKYGIIAGIALIAIVIVLVVILVHKPGPAKTAEDKKPVVVPIFEEEFKPGDWPLIMKGYSQFNLITNVPVNAIIDGKDYGLTPIRNLLLMSGFHDVRVKNEEYLIDETQQIYIEPGTPYEKTLALGHFGSVNLNAVPWAEVYVDEKFIGQTPIANLRLAVGTHEVKFKNPKFPIKKRNINVEEGTAMDVSVDLHFR